MPIIDADHKAPPFGASSYFSPPPYYSKIQVSQNASMEKVVIFAINFFAILIVINNCFSPFPPNVKVVINGGMVTLISILGLNLLFKSIQHVWNKMEKCEDIKISKERKLSTEKKLFYYDIFTYYLGNNENTDLYLQQIEEDGGERKEMKRNLLPEFERVIKI